MGPSQNFKIRKETRNSRDFSHFPGKLVQDNGQEILIRPIDISPRGLGFLCKQQLSTGTLMWFELGDKRIRVEVVFTDPHLGIDNLHRCGLFVRDEQIDLVKIFSLLGLLESASEGAA